MHARHRPVGIAEADLAVACRIVGQFVQPVRRRRDLEIVAIEFQSRAEAGGVTR